MVDHSGTAPESWIPSLRRDYNYQVFIITECFLDTNVKITNKNPPRRNQAVHLTSQIVGRTSLDTVSLYKRSCRPD